MVLNVNRPNKSCMNDMLYKWSSLHPCQALWCSGHMCQRDHIQRTPLSGVVNNDMFYRFFDYFHKMKLYTLVMWLITFHIEILDSCLDNVGLIYFIHAYQSCGCLFNSTTVRTVNFMVV